MRAMPFKVRFTFPQGRGFIDGYRTAGAAKAEVSRVNAKTEKTGVAAVYLGDERRQSLAARAAHQRLAS